MIRRIELVNFMSHARTVIEPAAGLTVLVGPNNCGKSAVVAALQILCHNENSTYVLRHNEKACSVTVETDDGHTITWGRTKTSPHYVIDGQRFDRLERTSVPDALHAALRLPRVAAGSEELDVHFGEQKKPIFLLGETPSCAAQFFASSSDAATLIEMQKLHQQSTADAKRQSKQLTEEVVQLARELAALAPIDEIDAGLVGLESAYRTVESVDAKIAHLAGSLAELRSADRSLQLIRARARAMAALAPVPVMGDVAALTRCARSIAAMALEVERTQHVAGALGRMQPQPTFGDEVAVRHAIVALSRQRAQLERLQRTHECLQGVRAIESPREVKPIEQMIAALERELQILRECNDRAQKERDAFAQLEREIAAFVREQPNCTACGAVLDPSKLTSHFHSASHGDSHGASHE